MRDGNHREAIKAFTRGVELGGASLSWFICSRSKVTKHENSRLESNKEEEEEKDTKTFLVSLLTQRGGRE